MRWTRWCTCAFLLLTLTVSAQPNQSWSQFLAGVREEALQQGVRPSVIDKAFKGLHAPSPRVVKFDRNQPEKRLTFLKYRNTRADAYRIKLGRRALSKHQHLLDKIGDEYGVSPCFIDSFWGLETSYGRYTGKFYVIQSLATLAYDGRRSQFFRKELILALHILNGDHISVENFKGEWAGATGQPQFLPSSFHKYAVDYSGNGKKDIWNEKGDIFASIANYLQQNGWQRNGPWAVDVTVPQHFNPKLMGLKQHRTVREWIAMGVRPIAGSLPAPGLSASIIEPYGGPVMMVFNNFKVIMKWNRSIYYAGTVGYLAEKICRTQL